MASDQLDIRLRHDSGGLRTWAHRGSSDRLVLCFSGIGRADQDCPPPEFARSATANGAHNVLFLSDPQRSWLNAPDLLDRMRDEIDSFRQLCTPRRVVAMGHSMGGFSALVAPSLTAVDQVLAFAPQLSVHPEVVPDDHRWANWRAGIDRFAIRSAADHLNRETAYCVIHGRHGREAPQRDRFPRPPNLRHYVMPRTNHNVPQRLKALGCLPAVTSLAIEGRARKLLMLMKSQANATLLAPDRAGFGAGMEPIAIRRVG
ncbi:alpha/beta hydrolase [Neptunicoccus sediminis]|uniref:alpha/beta hydrolase n=1 Tax=Neptunicoccus sediminis TaxID=1892596 RepID=UPI000845EC88|nr:alpha/beta hydrolase [Neptunicoccus sediminis]